MKKRIAALTMAALMAVTVLTGCSSKDDPIDHLVFTYVTAPLNVPSIVEKEKGIFAKAFEEDGISVEYVELTSGADQTQALATGDVQVLYAVGATSVILSAANGADIKVLNMYSRSPEAFCLFAQDETLTSPASLRGKTIAGPAGTILHELLVSYLATEDMTIDDVNYVNMSIPESKAALDGGSVDVAMLAGAAAYTAKQQGCSLVTDGTGLVDALIAVAVTEAFYNAHPEIIEKLKSAQDEIAAFLAENEEESLQITADTLELEPSAVKEMYAQYDFSAEVKESDRIGFQRTADFMLETGMIETELDINSLFFE